MKKIFREEKGITLVELLAVLAIGAIVMVLIMSIFSNGQKQYSAQTTKAEQLNDVRYAAKVITKEIRKADKVELSESSLALGTGAPITFTFSEEEILQNGTPLVSNIKDFTVSLEGRMLAIAIESTEENVENQAIETRIFIREGVVIE